MRRQTHWQSICLDPRLRWQYCPLDILRILFECYNDIDNARFPGSILFPPSQVCSTWRLACHSTPSLFTYLDIRNDGHAYKKMRAGVLPWWLNLSGGALLGVSISESEGQIPYRDDVFSRLVAVAHRWGAIELHIPILTLRILMHPGLLSQADRLYSLSIDAIPDSTEDMLEDTYAVLYDWDKVLVHVVHLPDLRDISMTGLDLRSVPRITCPRLENLSLTRCVFSMNELTTTLENSPLLTSIDFGECIIDGSPSKSEHCHNKLTFLVLHEVQISPESLVFLCLLLQRGSELLLSSLETFQSTREYLHDGAHPEFKMAEFSYSCREDQDLYPLIPFIFSHSPYLEEAEVEFDFMSHWPERLPDTLRRLSIELHRTSFLVDQFDEDRIRASLQTAVKLESLVISSYRDWPQDGADWELSFNPFIKALQLLYPNDGPMIAQCPKLQELVLVGILVDGSDLIELSRQRNELLLSNHGLEFVVSVRMCPLLLDVTEAKFEELEEALFDSDSDSDSEEE